MPDLNFQIQGAEQLPFAASPHVLFKVGIRDADPAGPTLLQSVLLRIQIRIEPTRRAHDPAAALRLRDLFGEPKRWGKTIRSMLWTHATLIVPAFTGETTVDLPLPCTFDFNVATTKYLYALGDGDVPLCFLFSGTMFYQAEQGLQASQISWEKEADFRLPVRVWKEMMALYYPKCAWLALHQDAFDHLYEYKIREGLPTWEQALEKLLATHETPLEAPSCEIRT
jgi:hypothetical protein